MPENDLISVKTIAEELGCRSQTVFKVMKRLKIEGKKRRDSSRKNQKVSYVTKTDSNRIRSELRLRNKQDNVSQQNTDNCESLSSEQGVFYLIQLEPEHDPQRFKLGYATDLDDRVRKHRCSAPFAKIIKTWPCRELWERTAIDCVSLGCEQLSREVFRANSLDDVMTRCERFFQLMPTLNGLE